MDNRFNKVFPSFNPLHPEFSPGHRVIDNFSSHFSFHLFNKSKNTNFKACIQQLNNLAFVSSSIPFHALILMDASVRNNIITSISHTHIHNRPVTKTLYHAVNVTSTEAELFAIRCGINQTTNHNNISKIIIVTDSIHMAKKIFDPSSHPYQIYAAVIFSKLHIFFLHHQENSIKFWECPSHSNWILHEAVDKKTKSFNPISLLPCKLFWNFSRQNKCDNIVNKWKMIF